LNKMTFDLDISKTSTSRSRSKVKVKVKVKVRGQRKKNVSLLWLWMLTTDHKVKVAKPIDAVRENTIFYFPSERGVLAGCS